MEYANMSIFHSTLESTASNRIEVLAVIGLLLFTSPWTPPAESQVGSKPSTPESPVLEALSGELQLDGIGLTGDAIRGLVILNLDKASISRECLDKFAPLKSEAEFQKRLCEQCKNPSSTLGAYVLLNTLYPDNRLNVVCGEIARTRDGMRDVPIKIVSGDVVMETAISREQFGVITYEYWRHHFGIKSEAELIYEEMVRKEEEKERQRKESKPPDSASPQK
jgi:hypothetical protein